MIHGLYVWPPHTVLWPQRTVLSRFTFVANAIKSKPIMKLEFDHWPLSLTYLLILARDTASREKYHLYQVYIKVYQPIMKLRTGQAKSGRTESRTHKHLKVRAITNSQQAGSIKLYLTMTHTKKYPSVKHLKFKIQDYVSRPCGHRWHYFG